MVILALILLIACASAPNDKIVVIKGTMISAEKVAGFYCFRVSTDTVLQMCRRPPTPTNKDVAKHAIGWIKYYGEHSQVIIAGYHIDGINEVHSGIDLIPLMLKIYDVDRDTWVEIDLTYGDSIAAEIARGAIGNVFPQLIRLGKKAILF